MRGKPPYPLNVPGDFYVENGCCTSCAIPFSLAPKHFTFDEKTKHCFVSRQPSDANETKTMIEAVDVSELACIRYRGKDSYVLQRLTDLGQKDQCDEFDV
jgi:hypothetical protein